LEDEAGMNLVIGPSHAIFYSQCLYELSGTEQIRRSMFHDLPEVDWLIALLGNCSKLGNQTLHQIAAIPAGMIRDRPRLIRIGSVSNLPRGSLKARLTVFHRFPQKASHQLGFC